MSLRDIAAGFRRISEELPLALADAEAASLSEGLELARKFSDGPLTPADLEKLDHPYARRHGTALRDPHQVNSQSEDFLNAWETEGPVVRGSALESSIFNTDPKADAFLAHGTDLMVPRQPHAKVAGLLEPRRAERIDRAIDQTLNG